MGFCFIKIAFVPNVDVNVIILGSPKLRNSIWMTQRKNEMFKCDLMTEIHEFYAQKEIKFLAKKTRHKNIQSTRIFWVLHAE